MTKRRINEELMSLDLKNNLEMDRFEIDSISNYSINGPPMKRRRLNSMTDAGFSKLVHSDDNEFVPKSIIIQSNNDSEHS